MTIKLESFGDDVVHRPALKSCKLQAKSNFKFELSAASAPTGPSSPVKLGAVDYYFYTNEKTAPGRIHHHSPIEIIRTEVKAKTRKLKTNWSIETVQDLHCYHGLDLEAEIAAAMSDEISKEIDAAVIADLTAEAKKQFVEEVIEPWFPPPSLKKGTLKNFQKVLLPLVRKLLPTMIASELVGVQPMTGPVGEIFKLKVESEESKTRQWAEQLVNSVDDGQNMPKGMHARMEGAPPPPKVDDLLSEWNKTKAELLDGLESSKQKALDDVMTDFAGSFYSPYVPLMRSGAVESETQPIAVMTRYGKVTLDPEASGTLTSPGVSVSIVDEDIWPPDLRHAGVTEKGHDAPNEIGDLEYFQNKLMISLAIPESYYKKEGPTEVEI